MAARDFTVDPSRLETKFSERTIGLTATCCCTICIWAILIPFFDVAGLGWIHGWEGNQNVEYPEQPIGNCIDAFEYVYLTPTQAWQAADTDQSQEISEAEWRSFCGYVNSQLGPAGKPTILAMSCFQNFHPQTNGSPLTRKEFFGTVGSKYHWKRQDSASQFRHKLATQFGSMAAACDKMDLDGDNSLSLQEFTNFTTTMDSEPMEEDQVWRLFMHLDKDQDGLISKKECGYTPGALRQRQIYNYGSSAGGCIAMDENKDSMISLGEFNREASDVAPPIAESDAKLLFDQMDVDKDGSLSLVPECYVSGNELTRQIQHFMPDKQIAFKAFDTDANGVLSHSEFKGIGQQTTPPISSGRMEELVEMTDTNEDGVVDVYEFEAETMLRCSFMMEVEYSNSSSLTSEVKDSLIQELGVMNPDVLQGNVNQETLGVYNVSYSVICNSDIRLAPYLEKCNTIEDSTFVQTLSSMGATVSGLRNATGYCIGPDCVALMTERIIYPTPAPTTSLAPTPAPSLEELLSQFLSTCDFSSLKSQVEGAEQDGSNSTAVPIARKQLEAFEDIKAAPENSTLLEYAISEGLAAGIPEACLSKDEAKEKNLEASEAQKAKEAAAEAAEQAAEKKKAEADAALAAKIPAEAKQAIDKAVAEGDAAGLRDAMKKATAGGALPSDLAREQEQLDALEGVDTAIAEKNAAGLKTSLDQAEKAGVPQSGLARGVSALSKLEATSAPTPAPTPAATLAPTPAPPPAPKAMPQAPAPAPPPEKVGHQEGHSDLADEVASKPAAKTVVPVLQLQNLKTVPALITAHAEIYFQPPPVPVTYPADDVITGAVLPAFKSEMESFLSRTEHVAGSMTNIKVTHTALGPTYPFIPNGKQLNITWTGDLVDGGAFMDSLQGGGQELEQVMPATIYQQVSDPWMSGMSIGVWNLISMQFYDPQNDVFAGSLLHMVTGTKLGRTSDSGSPPFAVSGNIATG